MYPLLLISLAFAGDKLPEPTITETKIEILPVRYATWCETPTVTVCRGSGLDPDLVADAFSFLEQDISEVKKGRCECNIREGEIQFGANKCFEMNKEKLHGQTTMFFNQGCLIGSVVGIKTNEPLVVTHEAGHAIGFMHSSLVNHVMFPYYESAGWFKLGME